MISFDPFDDDRGSTLTAKRCEDCWTSTGGPSMSVDEGPGASDSPTPVTYALGRDAAEAERLRRQTTDLQSLAANYWTESAPLRGKARSTSDAALVASRVARRVRRPPGAAS